MEQRESVLLAHVSIPAFTDQGLPWTCHPRIYEDLVALEMLCSDLQGPHCPGRAILWYYGPTPLRMPFSDLLEPCRPGNAIFRFVMAKMLWACRTQTNEGPTALDMPHLDL
eukprot:1158233-Pelagomonas_calceolata.AAC.19